MQKWEYLFVDSDHANDVWRPRLINGKELKDWKKGPTMYEFANQMEEQGWELVGPPQGSMHFKRPKE